MTFAPKEVSRELGTPVELYLFELDTDRFAYTNGEDSIVFDSVTYLPTPVSRSSVVSTVDSKENQIDITLPGDNAFARLYIGVIPGEFPEITIRQLHRNDPGSEAIFVFQGSVSSVGFVDNLRRAQLACQSITSASRRMMPRFTFQGLCNHNLYDGGCTEPEAANEEFATVTAVSGRTLTLTGISNLGSTTFWRGGFIQFGNEYRTVMVQAMDVVTLDLPFLNDPTSASVRILPGCDHIIDSDCLLKFGSGPDGNVINHSGWPYVPQKNPFVTGLD